MSSIYQEVASLSPEERQLFELLFKQEGIHSDEVPILRRHAVEFPLSLSQERVWASGQLWPHLPCDNVAVGFGLAGRLDVRALEKALSAVADRHEMLRVVFGVRNGSVFQTVEPERHYAIAVHDLRALPESTRWKTAHKHATSRARRPFDPLREPLLRVEAWQLSSTECLLLFVMHQLLLDGWSVELLLREISALYLQFTGGAPAELPVLPVQYGDFATWQRDDSRAARFEGQLRYWDEQLRGAPALQALPLDRPRPQVPGLASATAGFEMNPATTEALRRVGQAEGATLFMTLLALFQTILHQSSGNPDVLVGTAISSRTRSETEKLIGNFSNNLLLRTDFAGDPSFRQLLGRVRGVVTDAFANQELPLEQLVRAVQRQPGRRVVPQFQVMFLLRATGPEQCLRLPGVSVTSTHIDTGVSRLDLNLDVREVPEGLTGTLTYKTDLFNSATIEGILKQFQRLAGAVIENPDRRISELPAPPFVRGERSQAVAASDSSVAAPRQDCRAAQDEVEQQLQAIWQKILGLEPIGMGQTFFELGGHSLLAVMLFSEIERSFGRRLPLATLFKAPTIEQLARVLRNQNDAAPWSCLVPIRTGGRKPPLFLVHAIGGNLLNYNDLVAHIDPDVPVYGLQSQGLDGTSVPLTRVEEMAAQYLGEIRQVDPSGPYHIAGTSFGGVLAYEMARQLAEAGLPVGSVILLDSYHLHYGAPAHGNMVSKLKAYTDRIRFHVENLVFRDDRWKYLRTRMFIATGRIRRIIRNRTWEVAHNYYKLSGRPLPPALHRINDANHYAFRSYIPRPYDGRIILFRSTELSVAHSHDPVAAWRGLVKGGIEVYDVPGNHVTSMFEPHVRVVAQTLDACLARAHAAQLDPDRSGPSTDQR